MSRLVDRIRTCGCEPLRLSLIETGMSWSQDDVLRKHFLEQVAKSNKISSTAEIDRLVAAARENYSRNEPTSTELFDVGELENIPVFAADDVALYMNAQPEGTEISDIVSSMAPPFDKFFIEFQNIPNQRGYDKLHAWGVLVTAIPCTEGEPEDDGKPRWLLRLDLVLEREKNKPFGPVGHHIAGLAEDGTFFRHANGQLYWYGGMAKMPSPPPDDARAAYVAFMAQLLFPALLTISFLHCKNIEIKTVSPPDKLSDKHEKKHGRRLSSYHVLEISPLRKILEQIRSGQGIGFRKSLHICRGHFKTFTPDAPLFGRHIGKFWWPSQVKGSREKGITLKDYRVTAPSEIGKAYQEANESHPDIMHKASPSKDPDIFGSGLAAHNKTQNYIAKVIYQIGFIPRSPTADEPSFDLAWKMADSLYVCEVKSLTPQNEERQLRMAIGQVIRYRQKLNSLGHEPVMAVIATEAKPVDASWTDLCDSENILLIWPEIAEIRLKALDDIKL